MERSRQVKEDYGAKPRRRYLPKTMNDIGPDPAYKSILTYLTQEGGIYRLWNY
ncbi:MAG: hypothetical protein V3T92_04715 [Anaerolineae bacterium]